MGNEAIGSSKVIAIPIVCNKQFTAMVRERAGSLRCAEPAFSYNVNLSGLVSVIT